MTRTHLQRRIRGLYGIADAATPQDDPTKLAAQMLEGGCLIIQLRCKSWDLDATTRAAIEIGELCRRQGALFIVNDHPTIAVAAQADGVHLGQMDARTEAVRGIVGSNKLIGRSTNDLAQIAQASVGADYLAFGPIFETQNLSGPKPTRGLPLLQAARALTTHLPLVAIGGINRERLASVQSTGIDAWAVISAIANSDDPVAATRALCG
jgi:thiamine-phosphate pyrophosphorylase